MAASKRVLVTGATGKQGGAVTKSLLARGHRVRALCRNPTSPTAEALARRGVELVPGEIQGAALEGAMRDVDAAFALCTPFEGIREELRNGFALVDAARRAGLEHLVYSSAGSADRDTGIPTFESKRQIEEHLRESGVPYTIVGPAYFMENLGEPFTRGHLRKGVLARWMPVECKLQYIAVEDIGAFVTHVFENRERFLGRRIDLAGDELDGAEAAAVFSRVLGREIQPVALPLESFNVPGELGASIAIMLRWLGSTGFNADINGLRREYPEVGWHTLEDWVRAQDWSDVTSPSAASAGADSV
ncbi:NmrA/HSCARG family protein [Archangium sp.]|uniref:NmrA/HSCARG family protein n=1 Tax=Archangium sp. TaxID=1872627 RepID=UPI003899C004